MRRLLKKIMEFRIFQRKFIFLPSSESFLVEQKGQVQFDLRIKEMKAILIEKRKERKGM